MPNVADTITFGGFGGLEGDGVERSPARYGPPRQYRVCSGPLTLPNTNEENRVTVRLPDGREYLEMEVAQAMALKSTGAIRFDHRKAHSSLAEVEHTHEGIRRET